VISPFCQIFDFFFLNIVDFENGEYSHQSTFFVIAGVRVVLSFRKLYILNQLGEPRRMSHMRTFSDHGKKKVKKKIFFPRPVTFF